MRAQPSLKFVARRGDPWGLRSSLAFRSTSVRSLGSFALARSAPVVEVDAKVGVLSREKGVPGACLAALPVLPVIPNFLASTRACRSTMTLPSPVSPVWYARHYYIGPSEHAGSLIESTI